MDVFIVENSAAMRASLQSVLSDMPEVNVVGQTVNETGAVERIGALLPDVVILDHRLQSGSGVRLLENIMSRYATIKVIVFTHYTDEFSLDHCKLSGATYCFDKSFQLMHLRAILWKWAHTDRLNNMLLLNSQFNTSQH